MHHKPDQRHILGIDLIRFAAAALVALFHFGAILGGSQDNLPGIASRHLVAFPELHDWTWFGWIGVEIFFVISGFVIALSGQHASRYAFFSARVVRLVPGAWICSIVTFATLLLIGQPDVADALRGFRHSMLFLPWAPYIDGAFWTLNIEIAFYALVLLLIWNKQFARIRQLSIALALASLVYYSIFLLIAIGIPGGARLTALMLKFGRISELLLLRHGVFFALGVFLWLAFVKNDSHRNLRWIVFCLLVGPVEIVVHAAMFSSVPLTIGQIVFAPLFWIAMVVAIPLSVRMNNRLHQMPNGVITLVQFLGKMTFPFYLLHSLVGATLMANAVLLGFSRWQALGLAMTMILIATALIAAYAEPALQRVMRAALERARHWDMVRKVCHQVTSWSSR